MKENVSYLVVEPGTGLVTQTGELDAEGFRQSLGGRPDVVVVADRSLFATGDTFRNGGLVKIAPGRARVEGRRVLDLPVPCTVSIDEGAEIAVSDGSIEIEADVGGTYNVAIRSPSTYFQRVVVVIA